MKKLALTLMLSLLGVTPAFAHLNPAEHGSAVAGFSHPFFGLDHVLAMVGVGLWASLLGGRALWLAPAAFAVTMMAGFGMALTGIGLPFVEPAIAASVVVLGLLALVAVQAPTSVAMVLVGFFALFHGYAHGGELDNAGAAPFMGGFALATLLLHAAGVCIGLIAGSLFGGSAGRMTVRAAGGLTALGGIWIAIGA